MHPPAALSFDRLEVGREWVSASRVIRPADIETFTRLTGDGGPGHEDDDASAGCYAPGLFGPTVATGLALDAPAVRTIAFLAIRGWAFLGPIAAGDSLHIRNRVDAVRPRGVGRRAEVEWRVEVVNQREEVIQSGSIVSLVEGPAVHRRPGRSGPQPVPSSG